MHIHGVMLVGVAQTHTSHAYMKVSKLLYFGTLYFTWHFNQYTQQDSYSINTRNKIHI